MIPDQTNYELNKACRCWTDGSLNIDFGMNKNHLQSRASKEMSTGPKEPSLWPTLSEGGSRLL